MGHMDALTRFSIGGGFLGRFAALAMDVMVPYQERALRDEVEGAAKSQAIENFRLAAELLETGACNGAYYGEIFQDSDVAKWLEAAAYSLMARPDAALSRRMDEVIGLIAWAQHPDGYLNTYFTLRAPEERWTNLQEAHELYCAGHMMEAAVACAECAGKPELLGVMERMADHIYDRFITQGVSGVPGHPEIELALMQMYRYTGEAKYLRLAEHFINARGDDYFVRERERHPWTVWGSDPRNRAYTQCQAPARELTEATGHAVRAVYLYAGMAEIAQETGDAALRRACEALWRNIATKRMYVTGGIGSAYEGEVFTKDYHLPNDTAYSETCASIGLMFFARRLLELSACGEYADVMERALYNCALAGMQLDGRKFFYVNPLEVIPGISGEAVSHRHALPERPKWFGCACCPPNLARMLLSLGRYAWGIQEETVFSHLFVEGSLDLSDTHQGTLTVETGYPFDGRVTYRFAPEGEAMRLTLAIRAPGWSLHTTLRRNGQPVEAEERDGYLYVAGPFTARDVLEVTLDMEVQRVYAHPKISADSGRVAFQRGPLVYCAEGIDNAGDVLGLAVDAEAAPSAVQEQLLGGLTGITVQGYRQAPGEALYAVKRPAREPVAVRLIPYYAWANRGLTEMRVWLPEAAGHPIRKE